MRTKKTIYIISFIFLGILLQFLVHELVEIWYIGLLTKDFSKYGFGISWDNWYIIHHLASVVLLVAGVIFGFWQGKFWWRKIYGKDVRNLEKN